MNAVYGIVIITITAVIVGSIAYFFWIKKLKAELVQKNHESEMVQSWMVSQEKRLEDFGKFLLLDFNHIHKVALYISEIVPGNEFSFNDKEKVRIQKFLGKIYTALFKKEFKDATDGPDSFLKIITLNTRCLDSQNSILDEPDFKTKCFEVLEDAITKCKDYSELDTVYTQTLAWQPFAKWKLEWLPLFEAKAFEISKEEIETRSKYLKEKTETFGVVDGDWETFLEYVGESINVISRTMLTKTQSDELKEIFKETFQTMVRRMKARSTNGRQMQIATDTLKLFEKLYPE